MRNAVLASGAALALALFLPPATATAHATRDVADGRYAMEVGFRDEPTYLSQPNALFLKVTAYGSDGGPVEGLAATLEAEVAKDGQTLPLALVPQPEPGVYLAEFLPTAVGDYTFRVFGDIAGEPIDESLSSSPNTFASVEPAAILQFPVDAPEGEELVQALAGAEASAAAARTVAIVGVAFGGAGLLAGVVSIVLWRRQPQTNATRSIP